MCVHSLYYVCVYSMCTVCTVMSMCVLHCMSLPTCRRNSLCLYSLLYCIFTMALKSLHCPITPTALPPTDPTLSPSPPSPIHLPLPPLLSLSLHFSPTPSLYSSPRCIPRSLSQHPTELQARYHETCFRHYLFILLGLVRHHLLYLFQAEEL
jgi:hypothetical protein